jgi:hypothetical protein
MDQPVWCGSSHVTDTQANNLPGEKTLYTSPAAVAVGRETNLGSFD